MLQGYFKQQGLTPEQASEAMNQYKQAQATKQQEEAQRIQTMQQENAQLKAQILNSQIDAKVAELAGTLGPQHKQEDSSRLAEGIKALQAEMVSMINLTIFSE